MHRGLMGRPMRQLVYISNTRIDFPESELDSILAVSRRNNSARGITGLLLYLGGAFLQVLEGADQDVDAIYARIRSDTRHWETTMLLDQDMPRAFDGWSMGYQKLDAGEADDVFRISREAVDSRMNSNAAIALMTILKTFYRVQEGNRGRMDSLV